MSMFDTFNADNTNKEHYAEVKPIISDKGEVMSEGSVKVYTDEELAQAKTRLLSAVTGNSYLAETYQKEFASLKEKDYVGRYRDLINRLNSASAYEELEKLKIDSDALKEEMYTAYKNAQQGAVQDMQNAEAFGIVSRNRRQLLLDIEKDRYEAEKSQKQYEYLKQIDYVSKYKSLEQRINEAKTINQIDALKRETSDLRDSLHKDIKQAPYEEGLILQQRELAVVYERMSVEDSERICYMLGYDKESKSALKVREKAHMDYEKMLNAKGPEVTNLYNLRDEYLKSNIKKAFFLKCLKLEAKKRHLSSEERKEKYLAFSHGEFSYPEKLQTKIREKLAHNYIVHERPVPIYLLAGEEFEEAFNTEYSVAYRVRKIRADMSTNK